MAAETLVLPNFMSGGLIGPDTIAPSHALAAEFGTLVPATLGTWLGVEVQRMGDTTALVDPRTGKTHPSTLVSEMTTAAFDPILEQADPVIGDKVDLENDFQLLSYRAGHVAPGEALIAPGWHFDKLKTPNGDITGSDLIVVSYVNVLPTLVAHGQGSAEDAALMREARQADADTEEAAEKLGVGDLVNVNYAVQRFAVDALARGIITTDEPQPAPRELWIMDGDTLHSGVINDGDDPVFRVHWRLQIARRAALEALAA